MSGLLAFSGSRTTAQITFDNTLGPEGSKFDRQNVIGGGAKRGINLFHSFSEFNVSAGQTVLFTAQGAVNILSRVTGKNPSNIFGTLGVDGGTANLFLINPNGISFGPNAQLSLRGSFVATTANAIRLGTAGLFSASAPDSSNLLSVAPDALVFNQITASITDQGTLQAGDSGSLFLLGGNVSLDGGKVLAPGGQIELGGLAGAGELTIDSNGFFAFPNGIPKANVSLTSELVNAGSDTGIPGSIRIMGESISVVNSQITSKGNNNSQDSGFGTIQLAATGSVTLDRSSTLSTTNFGSGFAGDINISANDQISILNGSSIFSRGYFGRIFIGGSDKFPNSFSPKTVRIENASQLNTNNSTDPEFKRAGNITINAINNVLIGNSTITSDSSSSEFAGDISINAQDQISILNQSEVSSSGKFGRIFIGASSASNDDSSSPQTVHIDNSTLRTDNYSSSSAGDIYAGDIFIRANGSISLSNGTQIDSSTYRQGNAGNISVQTNGKVSLDNSSIFSTVQAGGVGHAGEIDVTAGSISLDSKSGIITSTLATSSDCGASVNCDAGIINLKASGNISLSNGSAILSGVEDKAARGNAGDVFIQTGSLSITSGAGIATQTFGIGDGGIVNVVASGDVSLDGSGTGILSTVEQNAVGNGMGIVIKARSLSLSDGGELQALTRGVGNAGDIVINTSEFVNLSGVDLASGASTGLSTGSEFGARGIGGKITVNTGDLRLSNGAVLSARTQNPNPFKGGDIEINVNNLELTGGGQIITTGSDSGLAGNITIHAANKVILSGYDPTFADRRQQTLAQSIAQYGSDQGPIIAMQIFDNADPGSSGIFVNNQGTGNAGQLKISARRLILNDRARITAATASGLDGGNIDLRGVKEYVVLSRNSNILTSSGSTSVNGKGGNIDVNTLFVIGTPRKDSNIIARAYGGTGGNIQISTIRLFNLARRPDILTTDDIDASSRFGLDGVVNVNALDIDPSRALVNVPVIPLPDLLARGCRQNGVQVANDEFISTGRGGLPPSPSDTLGSTVALEDLSNDGSKPVAISKTPEVSQQREQGTSISSGQNLSSQSAIAHSNRKPIVQAQGWVKEPNGDVILTAQSPTVIPQSSWTRTVSCHGS